MLESVIGMHFSLMLECDSHAFLSDARECDSLAFLSDARECDSLAFLSPTQFHRHHGFGGMRGPG